MSLEGVNGIDVEKLRDAIAKAAKVELPQFVMYGELMCNGFLYNYKEYKTFNVFGAMIKHPDLEATMSKLLSAGFACSITHDQDQESMIVLMLNGTLKKLLDS
jgi:hypothetical protein